MKLSGIIRVPIAHVLLSYTSCQMNVSFALKKTISSWDMPRIASHAFEKQNRVNAPHRSSRQPNSRCMFADKAIRRSQNRQSYHVNFLKWPYCSWKIRLYFLLTTSFPKVVNPWSNRLQSKNTNTGRAIETECTLPLGWLSDRYKSVLMRTARFTFVHSRSCSYKPSWE